MPVTVEDGTVVPNASSFVTEQEFIDFALARGVTVPSDKASTHLVLATDAIGMLEDRMPGTRTSTDQVLAFPRTDFYIGDTEYTENAIPNEVRLAELHAALASFNGIELMPVAQNGKILIRKKIGPIEKEYAFNKDQNTSPEIPQFEYYMSLLASKGVDYLSVRRV